MQASTLKDYKPYRFAPPYSSAAQRAQDLLRLMVFGLLFMAFVRPGTLQAQQLGTGLGSEKSSTMLITGRVVQDLTAQNITFDIQAGVNMVPVIPNESVINIDPTTTPITNTDDLSQPGSGFAVANGVAGASFQISFPPDILLINSTTGATLLLRYTIAHAPIVEQSSANIVNEGVQTFTMNEKGEYYFWFGGSVNISTIEEGTYEGDFFIEVEYTI